MDYDEYLLILIFICKFMFLLIQDNITTVHK